MASARRSCTDGSHGFGLVKLTPCVAGVTRSIAILIASSLDPGGNAILAMLTAPGPSSVDEKSAGSEPVSVKIADSDVTCG